MALWQKTVAPFSEHKGGVGPCLKIPRSNSVNNCVNCPKMKNFFFYIKVKNKNDFFMQYYIQTRQMEWQTV